jgi:integrase
MVEAHLAEHVATDGEAILFPARHGGHLASSTLYKSWYQARAAARRPDLRFHDLRHTGATHAAATGATLTDLMARLGHSTAAAALRYQHAAADRDAAIAESLAGFAALPRRPAE